MSIRRAQTLLRQATPSPNGNLLVKQHSVEVHTGKKYCILLIGWPRSWLNKPAVPGTQRATQRRFLIWGCELVVTGYSVKFLTFCHSLAEVVAGTAQ
jgi:hypothetical protein